VRDLADPLSGVARLDAGRFAVEAAAAHGCESAAVGLAKVARLLPAALVARIADPDADDLAAWAVRHNLLLVDGGDIFQYEYTSARRLRRVSEARVPLVGAENTRILAFRPVDGGLEHLAVVVGEPDPAQPVLTRLHSECFTGDLLGSLRCDCGEQLRAAIEAIGRAGSGVLLYLAQEGRGSGWSTAQLMSCRTGASITRATSNWLRRRQRVTSRRRDLHQAGDHPRPPAHQQSRESVALAPAASMWSSGCRTVSPISTTKLTCGPSGRAAATCSRQDRPGDRYYLPPPSGRVFPVN